VVSVIYINQ